MFFLLSKTIGVLLAPLNLIIAIGAVGLILVCSRYRSIGRKLVVVCVASLLVCGFLPVGTLLLVPLETRFPPGNGKQGDPAGIVILGGAINADLSEFYGTPVVGGGADRVVVAARLARHYPNARIVFAGGNANLLHNDAKEADFAIAVFEGFGITRDRIQIERRSRNTEENAILSKAVAAPKPGERWLLVTSAFHMPRAIGIFRHVGFTVEPYPVDWRTRGWRDLLTIQSDFLTGANLTNLAVREWLGLVAYRLAGKTDHLLPSPARATD